LERREKKIDKKPSSGGGKGSKGMTADIAAYGGVSQKSRAEGEISLVSPVISGQQKWEGLQGTTVKSERKTCHTTSQIR